MTQFSNERLRSLRIGISSYTENELVLDVIGKVGIGTTDSQNYALYVNGNTNIAGIVSISAISTNLYPGYPLTF